MSSRFKTIVLCICVISGLVCVTPVEARIVEWRPVNPENFTGSFYIDNTSEQQELFTFMLFGIGLTYNVTFELHANSTTGLNISLFPSTGKLLVGPKQIIIYPNERWTGVYVSHWTGDNWLHRYVYGELVDPEKNASGIFHVEKTKGNYLFDYGTGETYIANITEWLISSSQLSSVTTSDVVPFNQINIVLVIISCILLIRRKKRSSFS